ncbi:hypothetical protein [Actinoplanes flavus]|uniref:Tetratricopeptide repeat-containing protein n=1 Tax=Actinoplanes flavus TaxID=2820290 RepID=A0ABS3UZ63_9ACTN|nr:hypothetical protein [Actinoplanes flavus]MBO3743868.1 hypothetical protein [Actinoplanes flavus]
MPSDGKALDYFRQAMLITREIGDQAGEAVTRYNIATIHRDEGNLALAVIELEHVVDLGQQVEHLGLADDIALLEQLRQELAQSHTES